MATVAAYRQKSQNPTAPAPEGSPAESSAGAMLVFTGPVKASQTCAAAATLPATSVMSTDRIQNLRTMDTLPHRFARKQGARASGPPPSAACRAGNRPDGGPKPLASKPA